jgi:YVTN family beta-propeller protein
MFEHRLVVRALAAAALFAMAAAGPAAAMPFAYVPMSDNSVVVVDVATGSVVTTILDPSLSGPAYVASSRDAATVYIGNNASSTITVIATATNTVRGVINTGAVCAPLTSAGCTQAVAVSPDGATVYVSNGLTVTVASAATDTVITQITAGSGPGPLALTPDGRTLYVANINDGTVSVISTATDTVTATIGGVPGPTSAVMSPDGNTLYVVDNNGIGAISTAGNTLVQQLGPADGFELSSLAISPDGSTLYVTGADTNGFAVFWLTIASNTVTDTITIPFSAFGFFQDVAVTPDGSQLYCVSVSFFSTSQTSVSIYDTMTGALDNNFVLDPSAGTGVTGDFITPIPPPPPPPPPPPVPTLNEWALLVLGGGLAGVGALAATRRQSGAPVSSSMLNRRTTRNAARNRSTLPISSSSPRRWSSHASRRPCLRTGRRSATRRGRRGWRRWSRRRPRRSACHRRRS